LTSVSEGRNIITVDIVNMEVDSLRPLQIGNGITFMRNEAQMSQEGLAERLGIPRYQLSYYENGRAIADWETVKAMADVLICTMGDIYRPALLEIIKQAS